MLSESSTDLSDIRRDPSYIPFTPMPFQQPPQMPAPQGQHLPPMTAVLEEAPSADTVSPENGASAETPKPEPVQNAEQAEEAKSASEPKTTVPYSAVLKGPPSSTPGGDAFTGVQVLQQPAFLPGTGQTMPNAAAASLEPVPPLSPPNSANQYVSPWASHNPKASMPLTPPYPNENLPSDRRAGTFAKRRGSHHKGSARVGWRHVPGGVVGDDGTVIQHGPGQQIHPSPTKGPGSNSYTGLVDYCNLIVKVRCTESLIIS